MLELFDFKSIAENKQGKISQSQIENIKETVNPGLWLYVGVGILVLGGLVYAFAASAGSGLVNVFGWILVAVGLFAALRGFAIWNLHRKLLAAPVQMAAGTIKFNLPTHLDPGGFISKSNTGQSVHPLGLAGVNAKLPPGDYWFYYLKPRNWLLSAEPLSSEAELRDNLGRVLETIFAYGQTRLEDLRRQVKTGAVEAVEGLPGLEYELVNTTSEESETDYFCTLGGHKFKIPALGYTAIFPNLSHRGYFRAGEKVLLALELVNHP